MARITVEDCIDKFPSRFELVLIASNRARKLHSGEEATVEKDNDKSTVIALREIASETISKDKLKINLIEEYQTVSVNLEEDISDIDEDTSITEITDETVDNNFDDNLENNDEVNVSSVNSDNNDIDNQSDHQNNVEFEEENKET